VAWWLPIGPLLVLAGLGRRRACLLMAATAVAAGGLSGTLASDRVSATRDALLPDGVVTLAGRAETDLLGGDGRAYFRFRPTHIYDETWHHWEGPSIGVAIEAALIAAGDRVIVEGIVRSRPGSIRRGPVAGWIAASTVESIGPASDPLFATGNLLRARVLGGLEDRAERPEAALLAGFLIGEVRDLPDGDVDALRRTGLTHFVAVSGSNVGLFLTAWWLAAGPLGWGPRRRAVIGLAGLAVFVVATRWEPSVIRAATMASLVLGGRLAGVSVEAWTALGGAVVLLLVASGELARDVGFQLSVAATAGVLAGVRMGSGRRPRWLWQALAATAAAQAAVAPLLLIHFGTVPLLAPLANLLAAPLVAAATGLGGIGVVVGFEPLVGVGLLLARAVLGIARGMRHLPQLGAGGVAVVGLASVAALRPGLRPPIAVGGALVLAWLVVVPMAPPGGPEARILDVGQGDAILLRSPDGAVVLVDGGPDPGLLRDKLTALGVKSIDLVVITHRHEDHTGGLVGLGEVFGVGRVWRTEDPDTASLAAALAASGAIVETPEPGWRADVGWFSLEVLGPRRRYDSPNDESIVVLAHAGGGSLLLAGDIEVVAQRELGGVPADVLKVPHQGAATSDPAWLEATGASIAVISVGPNEFGHPDRQVIGLLEAMGAEVRRTDVEGDVVIRLDRVAR
jgi:competence protein ComEC